MVGGQEVERDAEIRPFAGLDRDHHLALEDVHRRSLPAGSLQPPEGLAMLLKALEHRRQPADAGLEDHGRHGGEAVEYAPRHHVVERVDHVHRKAETRRRHDVRQTVAARRAVLVPHRQRMQAELHAGVDDRLPERIEDGVGVLPALHRVGPHEDRLEPHLGRASHLGDGRLDVGERQRRHRDQPAVRAGAVLVHHPVVVDGADRGREVRQQRATREHEGRVEDGAGHAVRGVEVEPGAAVDRPARCVDDRVPLGLGAREDALQRHAHGAGQPHVLEHVLGADAAVHDLEVGDVDAVDLRVEDALLVAEEVRRERPQVARQTLDPEVARLDDVTVGIGEAVDRLAPGRMHGLSLLPSVTSGRRPCQSLDLIRCLTTLGCWRPAPRIRLAST